MGATATYRNKFMTLMEVEEKESNWVQLFLRNKNLVFSEPSDFCQVA